MGGLGLVETLNAQMIETALGPDGLGLWALIPAYNEAENLGSLIQTLVPFVQGVLVVDDGSDDGTDVGAARAGAHVLRHPMNRGKGAAIWNGLRHILSAGTSFEGNWIATLDADGQHDPGDLIGLVATAKADPGLRIIVGSRMTDPGSMPLIRYWTNRFTSSRISKLAGQAIPDSQCGYRLIHRDCLRVWKPTVFRFDSETEMLIHASRGGMRIGSARIRTIYREGMRPSRIHPVRDSLRYFQMMHRLKHPPEGDGR